MRQKITLLMLLLGFLMALLPLSANRSFTAKPKDLLEEVLDPVVSFSPDQVARIIVAEDSTFRIIDLRSSQEHLRTTIPGSVNIPYDDLIKTDPALWLSDRNIKNVFFSGGDIYANLALVYARGLGYNNCFVMEGGLQAWIDDIVESRFAGGRISARENAIYETRTRAAKLYTEINSLPDSLKSSFMNNKKFTRKKLDGGCE